MIPEAETAPSGLRRWWPYLVCLMVGALFTVWASVFIYRSSFVAIDGKRYFSLFDDAMISMRYAWNLSHGLGLVWNAGERVEGYTNPLWTLVMSVATLQGSKTSAVLIVQILGIVVVLAAASATFVLAGRVFADSPRSMRQVIQTASFVAATVYYPLASWSLSGMEAALLTVLALVGARLAIDLWRRPTTGLAVWLGVVWGLAYLTRPDAAVPALLVGIWFLARALWTKRPLRLRLTAWSAGVFLAFVVAWEIFRLAYYREWLPNTYVLKMSGIPLSIRLVDGAHFIAPFLPEVAPLLTIAAIGIVVRFSWEKLLLLTFFPTLLAYQIYIGGDAWPYWRMVMPAMPMLFLVAGGDLVQAGDWVARRAVAAGRPSRLRPSAATALGLMGAVLVLGVLVLAPDWRYRSQIALRSPAAGVDARHAEMDVAVVLNRVLGPHATLGVWKAGMIPYYVDRRSIDFYGKTDKHVARVAPDISDTKYAFGMRSIPGHNKYDLWYSLKQLKPTYAQSVVRGHDDLREWAAGYYVGYGIFGTQAYFLKDSPDVDWSGLAGFPPLQILPKTPGD